MSTSKDFCLIPADLIHKLTGFLENKSSYTMSKIAEMDMEMKKILDSETPLDDKIYLYNQVLRKYIDAKQKENARQEPTPPKQAKPNPPDTDIGAYTARKQLYKDVMDQFKTPATKTKADRIMAILSKEHNKKSLDFDTEGRMIVNGDMIPKSHITDVVDFLISPNKTTIPDGMREIYPVMQTMNFPETVISKTKKTNLEKMLKPPTLPDTYTPKKYTKRSRRRRRED